MTEETPYHQSGRQRREAQRAATRSTPATASAHPPRYTGSSISSAARNAILFALVFAAPDAVAQGGGTPPHRPIDNALSIVKPGGKNFPLSLQASPEENPKDASGKTFEVSTGILDVIDECRNCLLRLACPGANLAGFDELRVTKRIKRDEAGLSRQIDMYLKDVRGGRVTAHCLAPDGRDIDVRHVAIPALLRAEPVPSRSRVTAVAVTPPQAPSSASPAADTTPVPVPQATPAATATPMIPLAATRKAQAARQAATSPATPVPAPAPTPAPAPQAEPVASPLPTAQPQPTARPTDEYAAALAEAGVSAAAEPEPTPPPSPEAAAEPTPGPVPPLVKPPPRLTPEERAAREDERRWLAIRDEFVRWSVDAGAGGRLPLSGFHFEAPFAPQLGVMREMSERFALRISGGTRSVRQGVDTPLPLRPQRFPGRAYEGGVEALWRRAANDQVHVRYDVGAGVHAGLSVVSMESAAIQDPRYAGRVPGAWFALPHFAGVGMVSATHKGSGFGAFLRFAPGLTVAPPDLNGSYKVLPSVELGGGLIWRPGELLK